MRTLLMLAALGMAVGTRVAMAAALPTIPYEKYRLDNGLEVILAQDRSLPIVAVNVWYHVGAANEARLMCSWDTTAGDVDTFATDLKELVQKR